MFTTEFDHDEIAITILDDNGNYEDIKFLIYDDIVYIQQWDEMSKNTQIIGMSPEMFAELLIAMQNPEGAFIVKEE
jgi:hypothetical protein